MLRTGVLASEESFGKGFDVIPKVRTCGLLNRGRDLV